MEGSPLRMSLDEFGKLRPVLDLSIHNDPKVQLVCPFSDEALNEDLLGKEIFGNQISHNEKLGYFINTYAGHVLESDFRDRGSSGGMGSWILVELLRQGLVDKVIHVRGNSPSNDDPKLFSFDISSEIDEIRRGAKSRYYPVEMSNVISVMRRTPGRYVIVGIPCFIKAIRLLAREDPLIAQRIKFCVGLVCGHLKSAKFAEFQAWQCGIKPDNLLSIDFRTKLSGLPADKYGIEVKGKDGMERISPVSQLYGHDWGLGFLKYNACDFCDDVVAETADITIGDAWLPKYVRDSRGTNIVIVRNALFDKLIQAAIKDGRIVMERITPGETIASQESGFRHRREGLAYRLYKADQRVLWHPPKRVKPNRFRFNYLFRKIQQYRMLISRHSHLAFLEAVAADDLSLFVRRMAPLVKRYNFYIKCNHMMRKLTSLIK